MTSLTNFSNRFFLPVLILWLLSGCASPPSPAGLAGLDSVYLEADQDSPQAARAEITWQVRGIEQPESLRFAFILARGQSEETVQQGSEPRWKWQPDEPGVYRARVIVEDTLGNRIQSPWTPRYEVYSPLRILGLEANRDSPRTATAGPVTFSARTGGGLAPLTYTFTTIRHGRRLIVQEGSASQWEWHPDKPGSYEVRVAVTDAAGNRVEMTGATPYIILPALNDDSLLAVLPVQNLSGTKAPVDMMNVKLTERVRDLGLPVLEKTGLDDFLFRHRLRYTGSVSRGIFKAFREENDVEVLLFTVLELFEEGDNPKISMVSRLVLTGERPVILWLDTFSMSGDQSPGLLELGVIRDGDTLVEMALDSLTASLARFLTAEQEADATRASPPLEVDGTFSPAHFFRSPVLSPDLHYTIAVTPFFNLSERRYADEFLMLHFVQHLLQADNISVIEPGLVRQQLLEYRIILDDGLSLANADLLFSKLDCDLILTGKVLDYLDYQGRTGSPQVNFSTEMIEKRSRQTVWASKSFRGGSQGVFFFDFGKIYTAQQLAGKMTRSSTALILEE